MFTKFRRSLIAKMILSGGVTLLMCMVLWTGFNVVYFKRNVMTNVMSDIAMLSDTILLGLHYAMMLDSENDIKENINNISKQEDIRNIRIYNKEGHIVFSDRPAEVDTTVDLKSPSCWTCHQYDTPPATMSLSERSREFTADGHKLMGIMTPIPNSEGCSGGPCHVHSEDERLLGLLEVVVDMDRKNAMIGQFERSNLFISLLVFAATFFALFLFAYRFIFRPIRRFIAATKGVGSGAEYTEIEVSQLDEIGALGDAFNMMGNRVSETHKELTEQREEYRNLFENVPCLVSVVDRDFKVIRHNKAYAEHFGPAARKFCWQINKGRDAKCEVCPVERTFADGLAHMSEESGRSKDGAPIHWIVYTSPVRDRSGRIIAAMEMMIDITRRKELEQKLAASEHRYHAIYDSIPGAVFVLDAETLEILNSNDSSLLIYGWTREELKNRSFLDFFSDPDEDWAHLLRTRREIEQAGHLTKDGRRIYVVMRIAPTSFRDNEALIVTCSDVTKKLETEQQLIQAGKMTTLGEMSTGVAHELNQPLTILKTISNLLTRKVSRRKPLDPEILEEMAEGISTHVDRAGKIIEHMREFGRKSDLKTMPVQVNEVVERAFQFFSRQLEVRNIRVEWELDDSLPLIKADSNRLEQVLINLLLNARDAIEDRRHKEGNGEKDTDHRISIRTGVKDEKIFITICDTGTGIPKAARHKLFEPFFTTKEVGKGTGLGLSISYGIVKDYGGDIRAVDQTEEGDENSTGACFEITFPASDEE